jgi:hypothetical protein
MNNKKYNTVSKITQKESSSDKNKKHDKHPHKLLFHQPATNSDIYIKSETKLGYKHLTYRTGIINHR